MERLCFIQFIDFRVFFLLLFLTLLYYLLHLVWGTNLPLARFPGKGWEIGDTGFGRLENWDLLRLRLVYHH